jgi:hypothetical protein
MYRNIKMMVDFDYGKTEYPLTMNILNVMR